MFKFKVDGKEYRSNERFISGRLLKELVNCSGRAVSPLESLWFDPHSSARFEVLATLTESSPDWLVGEAQMLDLVSNGLEFWLLPPAHM